MPITLDELLASRDARHAMQQKLMAEHSGKTLVCLTVVMPGSVKRNLQFLLDEATASLDVENETTIQEALSRLIKNKTVLIIAHRMRTVAGADQVVVLSGGIVAEQGSPAELYARKGLYTHMVDLQSASQNWTI